MLNLKILKKYKNYFADAVEARPQNVIGIYLCKNSATVLCLDVQDRDKKLVGTFTLTVDQQAEQSLAHLTSLIAQGCAQRNWQFSDVAVALDSVLYMQHSLHSEFTDARQIAATVRFDTEEALSMDVTDLAIAFKMLAGTASGSTLTVFTARKKQLTEIIGVLQANNLDPAVCEPDVASLARFIPAVAAVPDDSNSLYCLLTLRSAYFIDFAKLQQPVITRTFITGPSHTADELLKREIPMITGLLGSHGPIDLVRLCDSDAAMDYQQLTKSLNLNTGPFDIALVASMPADCPDRIGFAIAYGAALSLLQREQSVNFRSDFMPFQGKKVVLEKWVKIFSAAVVILMVSLGLFFQMRLFQLDRYRYQLRQKFEKEYSLVMPGKKLERGTDPVKKLAGVVRQIKEAKSGLLNPGNKQTIAAKLTLILQAFNKCASQVHLNIDSVGISANTINIAGDTSSRDNTLKLFDTLRADKLDITKQQLESKGGRDSFSISVVPK